MFKFHTPPHPRHQVLGMSSVGWQSEGWHGLLTNQVGAAAALGNPASDDCVSRLQGECSASLIHT